MIKNKIKFYNLNKILYVIILILAILLLIIFPQYSISAFYDGLRIWATKVLPALLPFFILTKLLSYTNFITNLGKFISPLTRKLYNVGGVSGYIYIMSIISGYPVGAKLTSDLYLNGTINENQAKTITAFTSTSGPLFIIGTVAIGMFNNSTIGFIILFCHIIGAIINGLFYKMKKSELVYSFSQKTPENFLNESMNSSIISIMAVGGFIAMFYMFLTILIQINIFEPIFHLIELIGINSEISRSIFCGLIEVTTGCLQLSKTSLNFEGICLISTFLISFGGLSIHAQAYCFLKNFNMSYGLFFLQKLTQAVVSTLLCFLIMFFI